MDNFSAVGTLRGMSDPRAPRPARRLLGLALLAIAPVVAACGGGGDDGDTVTVYSGRSEELIGPILDRFAEETGTSVRVRYGDSAELAVLLAEEGDRSEADLFISQSPGALGYLDGEGLLGTLPADVLDLAVDGAKASDGTWVGLSGRQRVLVYNTDAVDPAELPDSVLDLTDPAWSGRIGVAPSNGSFQDFVSAMRVELGDEATMSWLEGLAANDPVIYANNNAITQAVGRGEVEVGLVNHYYNLRLKDELGDAQRAENHVFPNGDVGSLLIVSGASLVEGADAADPATELVRFLLATEAQTYFTDETFEYPLAVGATPNAVLPALDFRSADIDYDVLGGDLASTLEMIREAGLEG
jgi:iron(III) transport system substrate-binding protein